jgi:photosynthetic reaction center cytochrome c subunit
LVFTLITAVLVGSGYWVITFVSSQGSTEASQGGPAAAELPSPFYVNYLSNSWDYISGPSYLAMAAYQQEYEQPQNVQVLEGLNTQEVLGYMRNYFSAGLGEDCTYCHSLENFAAEEWGDPVAEEARYNAREHLRMTADLNQNWIATLADLSDQKQPSGAQIICATCHMGQAQFNTWPDEQMALPDDFRLLEDGENGMKVLPDIQVNARRDLSLDTVQYNQYVMYHMNTSMNVGCTHCHNSRYFPSYERPAKYYAEHMLQMSEYIYNEWGETMNGQEPSCTMCHNGAIIPPGSAISADVIPHMISTNPGEVSDAMTMGD